MILVFKRNDIVRQVEVDQIGGTEDEPQIYSAWYIDGEEELLTDDEMDELAYKYADTLAQSLRESRIDMAYDLYMDK
jgi:hypothetical protein